jgi:CheY-like chemotaxis protein/predicted small lipoprotein YifL
MNMKKQIALLLAVLMMLSLAACSTKDNDKMADMSSNDSAMTDEPKNAEEALALHKKLMEQENTILSQNTALWEKVFMEADKGMAMVEDGKNYGEFLLDTIENAKDQFTDEEYEMLKEAATEISNIENKLTELENKYPEIVQESVDGDMSVPAGSDMTNPPDDGSMQKFPAFEGKDLDGLDAGANDYLAKPFHLAELEARIRSLTLRQFTQQGVLLTCGDLAFDTRSRTASVNGQALTLTRKETGILEYLMVHQGRPVSQEELMDHVWDNSVDSFSNSIRVHISALRKKLRAALGYDPIRNRIGEGYLMGGKEA